MLPRDRLSKILCTYSNAPGLAGHVTILTRVEASNRGSLGGIGSGGGGGGRGGASGVLGTGEHGESAGDDDAGETHFE